MLTIKLMKYARNEDKSPASVAAIAMHTAQAVYLDYEKDGRAVLRFGELSITVGERENTEYDVAYVMNEAGKTVDTVR